MENIANLYNNELETSNNTVSNNNQLIQVIILF